jgi:hypothetical protein
MSKDHAAEDEYFGWRPLHAVCEKAASDDMVFEFFRRHPEELIARLPGAKIERGHPALPEADTVLGNCLIHW